MIPEDWKYTDGYPEAWIREWCCAIQCVCPYCSYGYGYNECILPFNNVKKLVKCETCDTEFWAIGDACKFGTETTIQEPNELRDHWFDRIVRGCMFWRW